MPLANYYEKDAEIPLVGYPVIPIHSDFWLDEKIEDRLWLKGDYTGGLPGDDSNRLTDDEDEMIKAYRRFKCRSMPGNVFKWKSPDNDEIVYPSEPTLLVHPQEVK
jgi:hypothetical protein